MTKSPSAKISFVGAPSAIALKLCGPAEKRSGARRREGAAVASGRRGGAFRPSLPVEHGALTADLPLVAVIAERSDT
jgi:hypothetical protein